MEATEKKRIVRKIGYILGQDTFKLSELEGDNRISFAHREYQGSCIAEIKVIGMGGVEVVVKNKHTGTLKEFDWYNFEDLPDETLGEVFDATELWHEKTFDKCQD